MYTQLSKIHRGNRICSSAFPPKYRGVGSCALLEMGLQFKLSKKLCENKFVKANTSTTESITPMRTDAYQTAWIWFNDTQQEQEVNLQAGGQQSRGAMISEII